VHHVLEWSLAAPSDTVVLVHGFADAAGTWDLVAPAIAESGLRVLAPDQRGFGDAPRAPGYYHFPDYVFDLADIIDALSPGAPVRLVGHSMGGTSATYFAGAFPERVASLALLEGLGPPDNGHDVAPDRMRTWIDQVRAARAPGREGERTVGTIEDALRRLAVTHARVEVDVLRTRLPHLVRDLGDGRVAWRFDPLHKTRAPMPFFAKSYEAFARRVACPVLFVSGGPLGFHPPDEEARLASFARLERIEIADAGHMMHWTRPSDLVAALARFWSG
jgi:pimeloyl-ACP methyl ester carboxylesterase